MNKDSSTISVTNTILGAIKCHVHNEKLSTCYTISTYYLQSQTNAYRSNCVTIFIFLYKLGLAACQILTITLDHLMLTMQLMQ